ncbi:MAG: peroxiredoxin [Phycisphaeraceae bacterium]|nr:peroxiredoxin [Phycisphaeraceae bacterium]
MHAVGSTLPAITIPPTPGLCDTPTPLANLLAMGPMVLYSYPADNTPLCTRQACIVRDTMRELASELHQSGLRVVAISPQGRTSHDRFAQRHELGFPIIADENKHILRALDALGPLGIPRRVTYLIDRDGRVLDAIAADVRLSRHRHFLERASSYVRDHGSPSN